MRVAGRKGLLEKVSAPFKLTNAASNGSRSRPTSSTSNHANDQSRFRGRARTTCKNIDVEIPRDKLIVVTGVSGSGKSSLAFDTIYAEGQRRLLASMSTFAKRFVGQLKKPDVDFVNGLSPVVSIDQKTVGSNPRSTVGTMTDISDYLRCCSPRWGRRTAPCAARPSRFARPIR